MPASRESPVNSAYNQLVDAHGSFCQKATPNSTMHGITILHHSLTSQCPITHKNALLVLCLQRNDRSKAIPLIDLTPPKLQ